MSQKQGQPWKERVDLARNVIEMAAIVGAAGWAIWAFGYKEWWVPKHAPPNVNVSVQLSVLSRHADTVVVGLTAALTNASDRRVELLGYWFNVSGYRIEEAEAKTFGARIDAHKAKVFLAAPPAFRAHQYAAGTPEASGRLSGEGWWLESGEVMTSQEALLISAAHDLVRAEVYARIATDSRSVQARWAPSGNKLNQTCLIRVGSNWEPFDRKNPRHRTLRGKYGLALARSEAAIPIALPDIGDQPTTVTAPALPKESSSQPKQSKGNTL